MRRVWAIVPAAGRGARFESAEHGTPKQYAALLGATVIEWSLAALLEEARVAGIVVALAADDTRWQAIAASLEHRRSENRQKVLTTLGGAGRQDSVMNALKALETHAAPDDWVLVHDAARPCLTAADLTALLDAVQPAVAAATADSDGAPVAQINGALLAVPVVDTVKRERGGIAVDTVDREGLWRALTPQIFTFAHLKQALEDAARAGIAVTDEAQAMERLGLPATLVRGSPFNIKITRADDLSMAENILKSLPPGRAAQQKLPVSQPQRLAPQQERLAPQVVRAQTEMRIGQGFDVHAFGAGDHVILGGVRIDHPKGIVAHSDGDVVIHALCDALLGALGEGDIGQHFPDSDARHRGADSRVFLREVAAMANAAGFIVVNADVTVMAEAPRIASHRAAMAANLAEDLGVAVRRINVKGTTTERLGFLGRGEGLAASAAVLLKGAAPASD